jgi:DNA-binding transcriptional regulator YiaG
MSKIATVLKDEIGRLARREVTAQTKVLRKANAQYRRDIADLKRRAKVLSKQVAYLEDQERKRLADEPQATTLKGKRFSVRSLKSHRAKVGLSAADYAKLVGVSGQTIYSWESGKSKPRDQQLAALVAVRDLGKREALRRLELLTG